MNRIKILALLGAGALVVGGCVPCIKDGTCVPTFPRPRPTGGAATSTAPPTRTPTIAPSTPTPPPATPSPATFGALMPTQKLSKVDTSCTCSKFVQQGCDVPMAQRPDPKFHLDLRNAFAAYKAQFPEQFKDGSNQFLFADDWNKFYVGVVVNLRRMGYEAVIDDCQACEKPSGHTCAREDGLCSADLCPDMICGDIQIAAKGTKFGQLSAVVEGYHILESSGKIRDPITAGGFRGTCSPKWY